MPFSKRSTSQLGCEVAPCRPVFTLQANDSSGPVRVGIPLGASGFFLREESRSGFIYPPFGQYGEARLQN